MIRFKFGSSRTDKGGSDYYVLANRLNNGSESFDSVINKINEDDLLSLDDIIRVLPSGKCDIDEEYHQRKKYEKG